VAALGGVPQHAEDVDAGVDVEGAGRLVAEEERDVLHQGACDRDPLLLAAGELAREVVHAIAEAHLVEGVPGAGLGVPAGELGQELDVLQCGECGHQVEELEDEADGGEAVVRAGILAQIGQGGAHDVEIATRGCIEGPDDVEHRRLAGAARPEHHHEFPAWDPERHVLEGVHRGVPGAVGLGEVLGADGVAGRSVDGGARCHVLAHFSTVDPGRASHRPSEGRGAAGC